ncbi:MAG: LysR family transcriptional regulator [Labilithrix sp.]|nr:LysR family transcriptional regulator [Labilithrix sp.]MCW5812959.1 LysR family transcriptional regulator [Labilithrix sp.]
MRADLFAGILPFVRTAEEKSFGRAAVSLGVTTAAVSKAVRKLEEDLGVKLLDRTSRAVTLTKDGAVFLERCREAVLGVQGARDAMSSARREPHGELGVTLPFILAPFVIPNLPRLAAQYPRLSFRLQITDRVARLPDPHHDVAIRMGALASSSLVARLLRKTRWTTVGAPAYLTRRPAPRSLADLAAHNCLRFVSPDGKPRDWSFVDGAAPRTVPVRGNVLVDHGAHLLAAAEAGMGLCQVLDFMTERSLKEGALVEVLAPFAAEGPSIHAVATPARASSVNVRAFLRFLVDVFRKT